MSVCVCVWVDDMFDEKVREDEEGKKEQEKSSVSFEWPLAINEQPAGTVEASLKT